MCFLIEVTTSTSQGTAQAIWAKENEDAALSNLHMTFASAMANPDVTSCLCVIITPNGAVLRNEYWIRPVYPDIPVESDEPTE